MREMILEKVKCIETEDWGGADECRLEVFADGKFQVPPLKKSLNNGQEWRMNHSYRFKNRIELKLWDEDSPDDDDLLGKSIVDASLRNHATVSFTGDDANYKLWYSVIEIPDEEEDNVAKAIDRFANSTKPGVWPYIAKDELLADLRRTVANPYFVDQGRTPLCGPASIVFELVSRRPLRYVEICQELYEEGQFHSRTGQVKPAKKLMESRLRSGVTVADWMLMSTLRDTENAIFDVEASSGEFVMGLTTPWEMKGWTYELLGYDRVEYESLYSYGEFEAMRRAKRIRENGGVAFLMVDKAMVTNVEPTLAYPDHWITFLGGLHIDDGIWYVWDSGHIKFDCYSWGRKYHVNLGEGPFEDYIWGIVTGV